MSLSLIALTIDMQVYTGLSPPESLASPGLTLPLKFCIDVLDCACHRHFLCWLSHLAPAFPFVLGDCRFVLEHPDERDVEEYTNCWDDVSRQTKETVG